MSALGVYGAGAAVTLGNRQLFLSPWTQGIMDAFQAWFLARLREERMETAGVLRKKARKLFKQANELREQGRSEVSDTWSEDVKKQKTDEWEDLAGEAQALEYEAREAVNDIDIKKTQGYFHFFGAACRESRDQFDGRVKIVHLMLLPKQPDITLQEVEFLATKYWEKLSKAITDATTEKNAAAGTDSPASTTTPPTTNTETPSTTDATAATATSK